jgi:acetyl-CoA carboxylase carboxyl transferase subunit alpha
VEGAAKRGLEFEEPVLDLDRKIAELERSGREGKEGELEKLRERLAELEERVYRNLSPWEQVLLARHPSRPTTKDYIDQMCDEFKELHGDRRFRDDPSIITGIGSIGQMRLVIVGQEKGHSTKEKIERNFGMASPEGFRKALRVMRLAERFKLPILSIIDTPGAYPGVGAEERGQPLAIAENIRDFFTIKAPIVVVLVGEGGSGGALALAVGDRVLMMEHAIYSVISPEGCAAILWKSKEKAPEAAAAMKLTAADCYEFGAVDVIIEEVHGAAHRDPAGNAARLRDILLGEFEALGQVPLDLLMQRRGEKYARIGVFEGDEPE